MTLLLALLLTMNEHYYFPKKYDERIKYFCDDYNSQGLEKMIIKVITYFALKFSVNQPRLTLIMMDADY